jgi:hypothetical protein
MPFDRGGKATANERKYPFIVEVPVLDVELNRMIVAFHGHRGASAPIWTHHLAKQATLFSMVLFRFRHGARLCRRVWRSVLQNNRQLI